MPRIRSLKPEITSDVKLASVSRDARLTFIYCITQSDDIGLLAGSHRQLLGALYPLDDDVTVPLLLGWIEELVSVDLIAWRETRDGVPVLQLVNWSKHQRVDNAGRSQLGALLADEESLAATRREPPRTAAKTDENSLNPQLEPSAVRRDSPQFAARTTDHRSPITDHQLVEDAKIRFCAAANIALANHPTRPQSIAKIFPNSGRSLTATERILATGAPIDFAEEVISRTAIDHSCDDGISSLNYFVGPVTRAWDERQNTPNGKRRRKTKAPQQYEYAPATTTEPTWRK